MGPKNTELLAQATNGVKPVPCLPLVCIRSSIAFV